MRRKRHKAAAEPARNSAVKKTDHRTVLLMIFGAPNVSQEEIPWYERNSFWGGLALCVTIILVAAPFRKEELRWLLLGAWPFLVTCLATALRPLAHSRTRLRWISFVALSLASFVVLIYFFMYLDAASNLSANIKIWAQDLRITVVEDSAPDDCTTFFNFPSKDAYFTYTLILQDGTKLVAERSKARFQSKFLSMHLAMCISDKTDATIRKLTPAQFDQVFNEVRLEQSNLASRDGVSQMMGFRTPIVLDNNTDHPIPIGWCIDYFLPIRPELDEVEFTRAIAEIDNTFVACTSALHIALARQVSSKSSQAVH